MHSTPKQLLATLEQIRNVPILVVGDLILDQYVWGDVKRISAEAPVPVVNIQRTEDRLGGAGNVVRNLRGIGAEAKICALIGEDKEAKILAELLHSAGVKKSILVTDKTRPSTSKTRVIAQRQQVVRLDREHARPPDLALQAELAKSLEQEIGSVKAVIVSDYGKGAISDAVLQVLEKAQSDKRFSMASCPLVVDPNHANFQHYKGITVAKPNRGEAEAATGIQIKDRETARQACEVLIKKWGAEAMMISLGADGLVLLPSAGSKPIFIDTVAREVFDVSGAGDTLTAVFTAALAVGASPQLAGDLGNIAAGIVVSEIGTSAVTLDKLKKEIESYS